MGNLAEMSDREKVAFLIEALRDAAFALRVRGYDKEASRYISYVREMRGEQQTTGLTPSQLVERVKELEEAAKLVLDWYEAENDHSKTDFYQRVQMCRDSEDALRSALSKARPNTAEGEATP